MAWSLTMTGDGDGADVLIAAKKLAKKHATAGTFVSPTGQETLVDPTPEPDPPRNPATEAPLQLVDRDTEPEPVEA